MKSSVTKALALFALATAVAGPPPARADNVTVGIGPNGFAFGYSDGWWDRDRHWHAWRDQAEYEQYRKERHDHFYEYRHDRDAGHDGWHDDDRYWDHR